MDNLNTEEVKDKNKKLREEAIDILRSSNHDNTSLISLLMQLNEMDK